MKKVPAAINYIIVSLICCFSTVTHAQPKQQSLYKVLTLTGVSHGARDLHEDKGNTGIWQKLLKLTTIASVLHTQAHPDDEHADLLTYLSRGRGVRSALLSLNRGESGGNVLGVESFDQLGLLRTEEFLLAAGYYGLDDLYFTKLVDYGFSKRVEEAYEKWGKQNVLAEMVRVIRINKPLVIISRFHGSARDGHGNHQAAGEISQLAFTLAGDPTAFPEQISNEGLRPWRALKLYRGGVRQNERWNIELNSGEYSPWLGQSYKNFSLLGYSFHRSQFGGYRRVVTGPSVQYYERLHSSVEVVEKESGFFDGIDTSITGIFKITGEVPPAGIEPVLEEIKSEINKAIRVFHPQNTTAILPLLTNGLSKMRRAIELAAKQPEARFMLQVKEQQFMNAINAVLGVHIEALAVPLATKDERSLFEPPPTMRFAVPGQPFKVETTLLNNSTAPLVPQSIQLVGATNWKIENNQQGLQILNANEKTVQRFTVTAASNSGFSQPYFSRNSLNENVYDLHEIQYQNLPWSAPALEVAASYLINGQIVHVQVPVQVMQPNLPYGYNRYTLKVAPAIAVNLRPASGIVLRDGRMKSFNMEVELVNNSDNAVKGELALKTPAGWRVEPGINVFSFTKAGEKINYSLKVFVPAIDKKNYEIKAVATADTKEYASGYEIIVHRDLDQAIQYHPAVATIKSIDARVSPGLRIGYVMGVGDEVPSGLQQLGAQVQLLNNKDLATGGLQQFDVIMVGTRAYAVRQDLNTYNQRLLEYTKNGGHLVVLFQTPEFVPDRMAPYPALLPGNSEEVSEENSLVTILQPNHKVFNYPNKITAKDFEHWVEQRGSKFFSKWDSAYLPMIATQDVGQLPQRGGWLMAKYGKGYYTYCAYSFHRQLPYAIEGAYRIMANLISYGKSK